MNFILASKFDAEDIVKKTWNSLVSVRVLPSKRVNVYNSAHPVNALCCSAIKNHENEEFCRNASYSLCVP